jgi:ribulose-phosphate 3-epimerase
MDDSLRADRDRPMGYIKDPVRTFELIRSQGAKVGLSINPSDSLEEAGNLLPELDMFLLLGVPPGFGGQTMAAETPNRIREIRKKIDCSNSNITIAVDGGVNLQNLPALLNAGADSVIMGTAIFQSDNSFVISVGKEFLTFQTTKLACRSLLKGYRFRLDTFRRRSHQTC